MSVETQSEQTSFSKTIKNLWRTSFIGPKQTPISEKNSDDPRSHSLELLRPDAASTIPTTTPRFLKEDEMTAKVIGGHEYIPESTYILATDDEDARRLDWQHHQLKAFLGGSIILAPIKKDKIKSILEVGYGSGIWALEIAVELPNARVFGFDIRASHVPPQRMSPNVLFQRANISKGLPYMARSFDYVHQRLCGLAATFDDFEGIFADYYRLLRPGGWLEVFEIGGTMHNDGPVSKKLIGTILKLGNARGLDSIKLKDFDQHIKKAGFTKIKKETRNANFWDAPGRPETSFLPMTLKVIQQSLPYAIELGITTKEEIEPLYDLWKEECTRLQTTMETYVFTAKKPA